MVPPAWRPRGRPERDHLMAPANGVGKIDGPLGRASGGKTWATRNTAGLVGRGPFSAATRDAAGAR